MEIVPAGAAEPVLRRGKLARQRLRRGDVVRLITGMGGGYGDPRERAAEAVGEDVRNGYLTWEEADAVYGVSGVMLNDPADRARRKGRR